MPEEETTQEQVEETTQAAEAEGTSQETQATEVQESTTTEAAESQEIDWEKRFKDLESYKTQVEQERATLRQQAELQQQQIQALTGQVQQQVDPLEAANAKYAQALQTFDEEQIRAAQVERDNVLIQRASQAATQQALQAMQVKQGVQRAQDNWGFNEAQLGETYQQIPNDPELLAVARAYRDGTLYDKMTAQKAADRQKAEDAKLRSSGMGTRARGSQPGAETKFEHVSPQTFLAWTPRKQAEYVEQHGVPDDVEVLTDDDE